MPQKERWFLWFLILVVLALILIKPFWGWQLRRFFSGVDRVVDTNSSLVLENQSLKSELLKLENLKNYFPSKAVGDNYIPTLIYSRYPFSLKDEIFIDRGLNQGVQVGKAAVIFPNNKEGEVSGILIGKIESVFPETSLVMTIFDERWSSPVGIGDKRIQALLRGGNKPKLTLIDKEATLKDGDLVYSLDAGFPSLLPLGVVRAPHLASDHLFQEADLEVGYNLNEVPILWARKN